MPDIERDDSRLLLARYRVISGPTTTYFSVNFAPAHDVRLDCAVDILTAPAPLGTPLGDRFAARAHIVAAFQHPALPLIHDMGLEGDRLVVVYRRDAARPLIDTLTQSTGDWRWTAERALLFATDVADALGLAHAAGLSHGSPDATNVLVRPDGTAMLQDLICPPALGTVDGAHGDRFGQQHDPRHDPRADVYALGALLRLLLDAMELRGDDAVRAVIRRATAPRPGDRYPDGAALAHALRWRVGRLAGRAGGRATTGRRAWVATALA